MNPIIPSLALAISCLCSSAQNITGPVGAKSWMLGGCTVAVSDVWSATNNPASAAASSHARYGLYSEQRFGEKNLRLANLSVVLPEKYVQVGATLSYYGYSVFNQQRLGFSLRKTLSRSFGLAVQFNYVSTYIEQYGQTGNIVPAVAVSAIPFKQLRIGFVVFNPTQRRYGRSVDERIPSFGKLGCAFDVSDKVALYLEADQALQRPLCWRGGLYYKVHDILHLAIGAATQPAYYTVGTALLMKNMKLDMAASFHEVLGFTPHMGLSLPVTQ